MNKRMLYHHEKCKAFKAVTLPFFQTYFETSYNLYDLCCGNGLAGAYFLDEKEVEKVVMVDLKSLMYRTKLQERNPGIVFINESIDNLIISEKPAALIGVHACGRLTDIVIEKAVDARVPFAVMPCCYNSEMNKYELREPPDGRKLVYPNEQSYYDAFRMQFAKERGYDVVLTTIDPKITPMNNVIVATPLNKP